MIAQRNESRDAIGGPEPLTVRIPVAMALLGLGRSKFYELMHDGSIVTIKVGRSRLVLMESLRAFVAARLRA